MKKCNVLRYVFMIMNLSSLFIFPLSSMELDFSSINLSPKQKLIREIKNRCKSLLLQKISPVSTIALEIVFEPEECDEGSLPALHFFEKTEHDCSLLIEGAQEGLITVSLFNNKTSEKSEILKSTCDFNVGDMVISSLRFLPDTHKVVVMWGDNLSLEIELLSLSENAPLLKKLLEKKTVRIMTCKQVSVPDKLTNYCAYMDTDENAAISFIHQNDIHMYPITYNDRFEEKENTMDKDNCLNMGLASLDLVVFDKRLCLVAFGHHNGTVTFCYCDNKEKKEILGPYEYCDEDNKQIVSSIEGIIIDLKNKQHILYIAGQEDFLKNLLPQDVLDLLGTKG